MQDILQLLATSQIILGPSSTPQPACTGLQEPIVYIFSLLFFQRHQIGSLKLSGGLRGLTPKKT